MGEVKRRASVKSGSRAAGGRERKQQKAKNRGAEEAAGVEVFGRRRKNS